MEIDCYVLLYRLVKLPVGINSTFGWLDCERYIGDIVTPWIVKPGLISFHTDYTVTLAG